MRELTIKELQIVSGGYLDPDLGDKLKNAKVPVSHMVVYRGIQSVGVAKAGYYGYKAGEFINEYTPIQDWISKGTDKIIDRQIQKAQQMQNDKSGIDYDSNATADDKSGNGYGD